jgi:hypothetical protein
MDGDKAGEEDVLSHWVRLCAEVIKKWEDSQEITSTAAQKRGGNTEDANS